VLHNFQSLSEGSLSVSLIMSSARNSQVPPSPSLSDAAPKRVRKSRKQTGIDDAQRERKREMDRKAQRLSREKNKSHIAHLEKLVEMLYQKNDKTANIELVEEVERLTAEVGRLRKVIWNVRNLVGGDMLGLVDLDQERRPPGIEAGEYGDTRASRKDSVFTNPKSFTESTGIETDGYLDANHFQESPSSSNDFSGTTAITASITDETSHEQDLDAMTFDCYDELIIPAQAAPHWSGLEDDFISNYTQTASTPQSTAQLWKFMNNPLNTIIPPPQFTRTNPCVLWQRANSIYSTVFSIPQAQRLQILNFDTGILFQVIRDGWDTLTGSERRNPILQILKQVDQQLFRHLDPISRLAIVYKSQALVKYFLSADQSTLKQLPLWQRPL
jgi:hypothetical protein